MNKLDKQFEQMMKVIKVDSPSSDFTLKVMSRIQAEAAVTRRSLLQDYQPVISKKTWIILIAAFIALMVYITVSGNDATPANGSGFWSTIAQSTNVFKTGESSVLHKGVGIFSSIPSIAYLIVLASLTLWTLDGFLGKLRHHSTEIHTK